MASRGAYCEVKPMEEAIEHIFHSMVIRGDYAEALENLEFCINKIPHYSVIRTIIFKILMKNCDQSIAVQAGLYLSNLLEIYPSSDCERRLYYKNALISGNNSFPNLWDVFFHIITSSFIHHKIYRSEDEDQLKEVQYPNCDILADFYVKVILDNYEHLSKEKAFFEKAEKSLVAELFWPSRSSSSNAPEENSQQLKLDTAYSVAKEYPQQFLRFINDIYVYAACTQKIKVFKVLHQLTNVMIKCIVSLECSFNTADISKSMPDSLICSSACVLDIVKVITNLCKGAFYSHENLRRFLNHITLKYFQFKIIEYWLYELLHDCKPSEQNKSPTTLHEIVNDYMFHNPQEKINKRLKKEKSKESKRKGINELEIKSSSSGDTLLHQACRQHKPADLYEYLHQKDSLDINAKNRDGHTPLQVACLSDANLCAKILIDESTAETFPRKLDWTAADKKGLTALHISIQRNLCDITLMILKKGGPALLRIVDKFGRKPFQYAHSKEMDFILRDFPLPSVDTEVVDINAVFKLSIPNHPLSPDRAEFNFREYALLCHSVHFLLTYYSDIYNLYEIFGLLRKRKAILVLQHEDQTCPHYKICPKNTVCSLDFEYLKRLPQIVEHFIKSATKCTKENNLLIDLELLPLQLYVACLNCSRN